MERDELIKQIKYHEAEAEKLREQLLTSDTSFDTWLHFAEKDHDSFVPDKKSCPKLRYILSHHCPSRHETIDLDDILEWADQEMEDWGEEDAKEFMEALHKELMDNNIGSFEYDW